MEDKVELDYGWACCLRPLAFGGRARDGMKLADRIRIHAGFCGDFGPGVDETRPVGAGRDDFVQSGTVGGQMEKGLSRAAHRAISIEFDRGVARIFQMNFCENSILLIERVGLRNAGPKGDAAGNLDRIGPARKAVSGLKDVDAVAPLA